MGYLLTLGLRVCETFIMSVGYNFLFSQAGIFFLGFPVLMGLGAYSYVIADKMHIAGPLAFLIMMGVCLIVSIAYVAAYIYLTNENFAVFTLASIVAFDALLKSWTEVTGGVLGIAGITRPAFGTTLQSLFWFEIILVLLLLVGAFCMLRSPFGRCVRAMKQDARALEALGVHVRKIGIWLIIWSGLFAACAGLLRAWRIQFLDPSFSGIPVLVVGVTVAILARIPAVWAILGSVLFVELIPEGLRFLSLPSAMVGQLRLLFYAVLVIVLIAIIGRRQQSLRTS